MTTLPINFTPHLLRRTSQYSLNEFPLSCTHQHYYSKPLYLLTFSDAPYCTHRHCKYGFCCKSVANYPFCCCTDELADIDFAQAFALLMELFVSTAKEVLTISKQKISDFVDKFFESIPDVLKIKLKTA